MITFIHTADIHFGMENYGRIDPTTGIHSRLLDFEKALNACIDVALEQNVDFFLFSGDAYKTATPSPTQQKLLLKCLLRLFKARIPVVIVIGNHDNPLTFGKAHALDLYGDLPLDGFYVISKPTSFVLQTKNGPIQIVGIPWPTRNTVAISNKHVFKTPSELTEYISKMVTALIQDFAQSLDPEIPAVLASHLTVTTGIFSGSEKRAIYGTDPLFLPSQLALPQFDYVALGHLHRYQDLNPHGYPAVVYSGSIERIDFGERKEDKGFCLVKIEKRGSTTHEFIRVPIRKFVQIEVQLQPEKDQTEQLAKAIAEHDISDAVIKILYHLPPGKKDTVDLQIIQKACTQALHCVGIIPIRKPEVREQRASLKVHMDLKSLLTNYFITKPDLAAKKEQLIDLALSLQAELEQQESES